MRSGAANIVFWGVKPSYHSEKYGCMVPKISGSELPTVLQFKTPQIRQGS